MSRILVVDDSADIRNLLRDILGQEEHEVIAAKDGAQALEIMLLKPPDLVLLDVMMPVKDGFSVLKDMKARGLADIKVIVLTAKSSESDWLRGYKLGADHYLTKPFELDELLDAVAFVLTTPKSMLRIRREKEVHKAQLLARLESTFDEAP